MVMVVVDDSCLQADSQPKSGGLVRGSTAKWTEWTLAMTFSDDSTINIVLGLGLLLLFYASNFSPVKSYDCDHGLKKIILV